jgi:hypothetical protein
MSQNFAHFSSIIASAHSKIASIHMDLVNQLQRAVSENSQAQICPPSPGLSDTTCDMNAQKLLSEDDDFADSPILSNSNALLRAKSKHKAPVASRMKLKKAASDAPIRKFSNAAFFVFQAENRLKVSEISRSFAIFHFRLQMKSSSPQLNAKELSKALGLEVRNATGFVADVPFKFIFFLYSGVT